MTQQPPKMSGIMLEMAIRVMRNPRAEPSSEAAHVALMFANIAWNESLGLVRPRQNFRAAWEEIEAENIDLWSEFKSNDVDAMIDELVQFKKQHYPDDQRRIFICGLMPTGNIRVEWLPPVAPGVDSLWELELYGLVGMRDCEGAIEFLRKTRSLSRSDAAVRVAEIAVQFGSR